MSNARLGSFPIFANSFGGVSLGLMETGRPVFDRGEDSNISLLDETVQLIILTG
jgi:hypothetical protein